MLSYYAPINLDKARIKKGLESGIIYNGKWAWKQSGTWNHTNEVYLRIIAVHTGTFQGVQVGNARSDVDIIEETDAGYFVVIATDIGSGTSVINGTNDFIWSLLDSFHHSHGMTCWNTAFVDRYVQDQYIPRSIPGGQGEFRLICLDGITQKGSVIPEHRGALHDGPVEKVLVGTPTGDCTYQGLGEEDLNDFCGNLWKAEHIHSIDNGRWPAYDEVQERLGYLHEDADQELIGLIRDYDGKVNVTIRESVGVETITNRFIVMASERRQYGPLGFDYILVTPRGEPKNPNHYTPFPWKSVLHIDSAGKKGKRLWTRS